MRIGLWVYSLSVSSIQFTFWWSCSAIVAYHQIGHIFEIAECIAYVCGDPDDSDEIKV